MTALKEYLRLETTGLWRPTPEGQRREVGVAFGDATLVIADTAGRPLTHWSLPAVTRINPGQRPAIYCPDTDTTETLEIEDEMMIGAIERVRQSVARQTPRPGRLRQCMVAGSLALVLGLAVFWLPGALSRQTLSVVPPSKRSEIGAVLLGHIQRIAGATCRDPVGTQALTALNTRLFGPDRLGQIVVVPGDLPAALNLPGGIIVLGKRMVEEAAEPAVVAGYVLAAVAETGGTDALAPVLSAAGLTGTLRLLTTGDIPSDVLETYATDIVAAATTIPDPTDRLVATFGAAGVPVGPWALALDPTGETILPLIEADPLAGRTAPLILTDDAWVSLQGICRE